MGKSRAQNPNPNGIDRRTEIEIDARRRDECGGINSFFRGIRVREGGRNLQEKMATSRREEKQVGTKTLMGVPFLIVRLFCYRAPLFCTCGSRTDLLSEFKTAEDFARVRKVDLVLHRTWYTIGILRFLPKKNYL